VNFTPEQQQALIKQIENRWNLYAKKKTVSHNHRKNFYKTARELFESLLVDGEYFVICRYSQSRRTNPLTLQYVDPSDVMKISSQVKPGNTEINGIEYDADGREVAYHVISNRDRNRSVRIEKIGPRSGRVFVIHETIGKGPRGTGILVGIITELTKLSDLQASELQAALINSLFAVWVETDIGGQDKTFINSKNKGAPVNKTGTPPPVFNDTEFQADLKSTGFGGNGIIAQGLGEGQKLHSFDTKRPTANFEQFYSAVKRNIYSARGMSIAVADYRFDGSYSAARGELLVFWQKVLTFRFDEAMGFYSVVNQMWLWGEVDRGKINMPGWENEELRDAWSNSNWQGPQRPDIDPLRSFKASEGEIKEGLKTRQQVTAERGGGDHDENVKRLTSENDKLADANKPLVELEKTTFSHSENKTESKTETVEPGETSDDNTSGEE